MNLKQWLEREDESPEAFAKRIGRDRATIYRIIKGDGYQPSLGTAIAIRDGTGGEVGIESLAGAQSAA